MILQDVKLFFREHVRVRRNVLQFPSTKYIIKHLLSRIRKFGRKLCNFLLKVCYFHRAPSKDTFGILYRPKCNFGYPNISLTVGGSIIVHNDGSE